MDSESHDQDHHQLHIFVLPFIAPGHMIPIVDITKLFAARPGVKVSIITTTHNAILLKTSIDRDISFRRQLQLHILKFPSEQVGLPEGIENFNSVTSSDMAPKLYQAISILQPDIEQLIRDNHPDCIISDMFYPWSADLALELGRPRITFNGSNFFSQCAMNSIWSHKPHDKVSTDTETFVIPELPDEVEMTRLQLPDHVRARTNYSYVMDVVTESEMKSCGHLVNSFYELESSYVDHFRNYMGRKAWHLGPVSLAVKQEEIVVKHECLSWLNSMKPNSVVYISVGSLSQSPKAQLVEIAFALEESGHPFIWVVRERESKSKEETTEEKWLPEEIGGFVTHCGWNSTLESIAAGVPIIAWPLFSEQLYNEKLITQVLKIAVRVGVEAWTSLLDELKVLVKREKIIKAVSWLMDGGDEAEEMRKRVKEVSMMAKRAVEEGGSSYASLSDLIEELKKLRRIRISK